MHLFCVVGDSKDLKLEVNKRVVRAGDHRHAAQDEDGQKGHVGEHVHGGHGAGAASGHGALADHLAGRHGGVALLRGGDDGAMRVALGPGLDLLAQPRRPWQRTHDKDGHEAHVTPRLQLPERGGAQPPVGAEHGAEPLPHVRKPRHGEQEPPEEEQHDAPDMAHEPRQPIERPHDEELLQQDEHAPVQAPQKEVLRGAVPDARQAPHDHGVQHEARRAHAVAAERDVHVVAEEAAERHVPAAPKLRGRLRRVGVVEVARVLEAHHLAKADSHVRVAGEVEVNLEGVGGHAREAADKADLGRLAGQQRVGQHAGGVGEQHLLAQAHAEQPQALSEALQRGAAVIDLVLDVGVAHDGASHQLREHGDVHAEVQRVLLHLHLAAIDIHHVGDGLQGEERDADRQRQVQLGDELLADGAVDVLGQKALVLVEPEHEQVGRERRHEPEPLRCRLALAALADNEGEQPVEADGGRHEPHVHRLAPSVEQKREQQQDHVLRRPPRHGEVNRQEQRQKCEQEYRAGKDHDAILAESLMPLPCHLSLAVLGQYKSLDEHEEGMLQ